MEPLPLFLIVGQIQLAAFKGAHNVLRSPLLDRPPWALREPGHSIMGLLFSISGLCFAFTLVYGFFHLEWWIPLVALILGFPFAYYLFIRPITGDIFPMTVGSLLSVIGAIWIGISWFF